MRKARSLFRPPPGLPFTRHLCHSAFSGPWPGMTPRELDATREMLLEQATFTSVRVLAFSLRPCSFDILLEVPSRVKLSKKEMLARFEANFSPVSESVIAVALRSNAPGAVGKSAEYFGSVPFFLKRFKQAISIAYHREHQTSGSLWESRYDATLVEPGHTTRVVAAWMDHGCVRAQVGENPEASPHCTIGSAVKGNKEARGMIREIFAEGGAARTWPATLRSWRGFCAGEPEGAIVRKSNLSQTEPLRRAELLRQPVPHFHGGLAVGSHDFIERAFECNRDWFPDGRTSGPRFITGQNDPALFVLRYKGDLRKPPRPRRKNRRI